MTEDDERLLRACVTTLWSTADDVDQAINGIVALVRDLQNQEVQLWKDRCAAAQQAHEATIKHFEDEARNDW
jgi:hypothetical protein